MRFSTTAAVTATCVYALASVLGSACSGSTTDRGGEAGEGQGGDDDPGTTGHTSSQDSGGSSSGKGGAKATGGAESGKGGDATAGKDDNAGGSDESGGTQGKGGRRAAGGAQNTGGKVAAGGTRNPGGAPGTGGKQTTGGAQNTGGSQGGQQNAGGRQAAGGTQNPGGGGGGTPPPSSCGLPDGPSSGVAEPTGAGTTITVLPWAGFKAAVTFSLDDGNQSQITNYATLNGMGVPLTFYLITQNANDQVWKQALNDGHEIGNHTQNHSCGTTSGGAKDINSKFGVTAYTMAAPNGDTACSSQAQQNGIFINRGVSDAVISFTADDSSLAYNLNTNIPPSGAGASSITGPIDKAYAAGGWQTFCIHGFTGDASAYNAFPLSSFTDAVKTEKQKKDLWFDTMVAVGAYWRGARAFAKATPTTSGTDKTWTWTLPKGFPPGKCLRVKTDGGTLKQGGTAIPWDSHGYYEISLDANSVTLSSSQ